MLTDNVSEHGEKDKKETCIENLRGLPIESTKEVLKKIIEEKSLKEQKDIITSISSPIGPPSTKIRDSLWYVVIISFALVLVGSFLTLAIGVFWGNRTSPELILSLFTSVVGFLAGLFAPSPIANSQS